MIVAVTQLDKNKQGIIKIQPTSNGILTENFVFEVDINSSKKIVDITAKELIEFALQKHIEKNE